MDFSGTLPTSEVLDVAGCHKACNQVLTGTFSAGISKLLHRETCRCCKRPGSKLVTPGMPMRGEKLVSPGMPRHGPESCVLQQLLEATWRCCNGCTRMAAIGIRARAQARPVGATWQFCSGRDTMAAAGMRTPAPRQLAEATWQSCSGLATMAAAGMSGPAPRQLQEATWQC